MILFCKFRKHFSFNAIPRPEGIGKGKRGLLLRKRLFGASLMAMTTTDEVLAWNWEHSYSQLPNRCFSKVDPTPVAAPRLFAFNEALADDLGLREGQTASPDALAEIFSGNRIPAGAQPLAMAYAGHQFGHLTNLGDGRAILLGEHIDPAGRRHDIQLKGSGQTPYSRSGDGRAALGPMLRELLISEAMAALGIPTTRSLAVVETGEKVYRDDALPGAILVRTAASHLRIGTFVLFAAMEDREMLEALLTYTISRHYPDLAAAATPALALLEAVALRQAELVAQWLSVGFVHGVLNTDNVALSGETIDYGPCAFIDRYHPTAVYSSIDRRGRYAYGNQPGITAWNLARFAESLLPLIHPDQDTAMAQAQEKLQQFEPAYDAAWLKQMGPKLGIAEPQATDKNLIEDWLNLLEQHRLDFTNSFRALAGDDNHEQQAMAHADFIAWRKRLDQRLSTSDPIAVQQLRDASNPRQIPRNHAVQKALDAAEAGDPSPFFAALAILRSPFESNSDTQFSATPSAGDQVHTTFCGT